MATILVEMLPLMLSAALVPAPLIVVLILLQGRGGLGAAAAFVAGMTVVRLAQGALFGVVFVDALAASGSGDARPVASTLLVVLGVVLWTTAIRTLLKAPDPDAPPPAWMERLRSATPLAAFAMGAALIAIAAKQWVFTMGALGIIVEQTERQRDALIAYLIFVLGAELLLLLPLLGSAVAPGPASAFVTGAAGWMERNMRPIKIVVSVVFGTYFLWKGIGGLI